MNETEVQGKLKRLVQQLDSATRNGKIVWSDTADEDAFRATMPGGMVRVQKRERTDEEGQEQNEFSLTVLDRNGRELEYFRPIDPKGHNEIVDLWILARRSARGTVSVLDNLLRETASVD